MSRFLRRCRAVPSFFSFQLFDDIDALKVTVDKLTQELDDAIRRRVTQQIEYGGSTLPRTNADDWLMRIETLSNYMKRSCRLMMQRYFGKDTATCLPTSVIGNVVYRRMSAQLAPTL